MKKKLISMLLKEPRYRSIMVEFFVRMSSSFGFIVLLIYVFEKTNKTLDLGYVSASMIIPSIIFSFFSERIVFGLKPLWSFRWFSITRGMIFILAPLIAINTIAIAIIAALTSFFYQIIYTSKLTYDSILIPSGEKTKFNSLRGLMRNVATIAGPALAGLVSGTLGGNIGLIITGIFSLIGAFLLINMDFSRKEVTTKTENIQNNKNTLSWLKKQKELLILLATYIAVVAILEMEAPLVFPFVKESYHYGPKISGFLFGVCGFGGFIGSYFMYRYAGTVSGWLISLLLAMDGLTLFLTTLIPPISVTFILFVFLGLIGSINMITVESHAQEFVPMKFQPVIFSILSFAGGVGGASLTLVSTRLADIFGAVSVLKQCAIFEIVLGLCAVLLIKLVIRKKVLAGDEV